MPCWRKACAEQPFHLFAAPKHGCRPCSEIPVNLIHTPVSLGELADKITILQIKAERITQPERVAHVRTELDGLLPLWADAIAGTPELEAVKDQLKTINAQMWDIQDGLRAREKSGTFDDEFIRLARAVMTTNAARVKLKNDINRRAGSAFIEEKQYKAEPGN